MWLTITLVVTASIAIITSYAYSVIKELERELDAKQEKINEQTKSLLKQRNANMNLQDQYNRLLSDYRNLYAKLAVATKQK
jgi:uncharacterized membrane-anchored protein YhcB (DUF1043 family)